MPRKKPPVVAHLPSQTVSALTRKQIVATLRDEPPETWLAYRELEDGGAVVITASGQKYRYTAQFLAEQQRKLTALS